MIRDALAVVRPAFDSASKHLVRAAVMTPLFFLPQERRTRVERRLRGREQYAKLRRADLVVVSFGKSGRTWLRVMLSRFYGFKHGLAERLLIGFDNLHLRNPAIPRVFFTHDNYTKDFTGNVDNKADYYDRKVVLLVRHPADVAVSQYHQWRFRMRPHKKTINDYPEHGHDVPIFDFVARHEAGLGKVIGFMNDWAREIPRLGNLLIVRYEDMRSAPEVELKRIAEFAGTPGTAEEIAEAVRFASFENMRKLEQNRTFWFSGGRMTARDRSNPNSFKTRRGKVGGWRDYFSDAEAAQIDAIVDARLLPHFGYTGKEREQAAVA
jgi:Sulfotransferase domain